MGNQPIKAATEEQQTSIISTTVPIKGSGDLPNGAAIEAKDILIEDGRTYSAKNWDKRDNLITYETNEKDPKNRGVTYAKFIEGQWRFGEKKEGKWVPTDRFQASSPKPSTTTQSKWVRGGGFYLGLRYQGGETEVGGYGSDLGNLKMAETNPEGEAQFRLMTISGVFGGQLGIYRPLAANRRASLSFSGNIRVGATLGAGVLSSSNNPVIGGAPSFLAGGIEVGARAYLRAGFGNDAFGFGIAPGLRFTQAWLRGPDKQEIQSAPGYPGIETFDLSSGQARTLALDLAALDFANGALTVVASWNPIDQWIFNEAKKRGKFDPPQVTTQHLTGVVAPSFTVTAEGYIPAKNEKAKPKVDTAAVCAETAASTVISATGEFFAGRNKVLSELQASGLSAEEAIAHLKSQLPKAREKLMAEFKEMKIQELRTATQGGVKVTQQQIEEFRKLPYDHENLAELRTDIDAFLKELNFIVPEQKNAKGVITKAAELVDEKQRPKFFGGVTRGSSVTFTKEGTPILPKDGCPSAEKFKAAVKVLKEIKAPEKKKETPPPPPEPTVNAFNTGLLVNNGAVIIYKSAQPGYAFTKVGRDRKYDREMTSLKIIGEAVRKPDYKSDRTPEQAARLIRPFTQGDNTVSFATLIQILQLKQKPDFLSQEEFENIKILAPYGTLHIVGKADSRIRKGSKTRDKQKADLYNPSPENIILSGDRATPVETAILAAKTPFKVKSHNLENAKGVKVGEKTLLHLILSSELGGATGIQRAQNRGIYFYFTLDDMAGYERDRARGIAKSLKSTPVKTEVPAAPAPTNGKDDKVINAAEDPGRANRRIVPDVQKARRSEKSGEKQLAPVPAAQQVAGPGVLQSKQLPADDDGQSASSPPDMASTPPPPENPNKEKPDAGARPITPPDPRL